MPQASPTSTKRPAMEETLGYYDANAQAFVRFSVDVALSDIWWRFTRYLSLGARTLRDNGDDGAVDVFRAPTPSSLGHATVRPLD